MGIKPAGIPLRVISDGVTLEQSAGVIGVLASGISSTHLQQSCVSVGNLSQPGMASSISTAVLQQSCVDTGNIINSSISTAKLQLSSVSRANLANDALNKIYENILTTPASTISITGLNGWADRGYEIIISALENSISSGTISLLPNNVSTDGQSFIIRGSSGSVAVLTTATIYLGGLSTGGQCAIRSHFFTRAGGHKRFMTEGTNDATGTNVTEHISSLFTQSDNITSMTIRLDGGAAFASGSIFILRRIG